ncbi:MULTISPECIES: hypothetical protein [Streptomyces]|uniref:Uncharacterized protein n=1 Tax=Streptomyces spororaveus TaxID=284039 RepID=A0ABQ3T5L4_9ACTN|nr:MULTISPECIES: hypothetical protein [Streptomyces]MCM9076521.1 hypothetical protein [Streptomyces spororaveus]MCX5308822.1 hypothetical protein [Streptomyces sp. NBC_00160]GHI75683.1 hypothetical protein Sspor_12440 [Streptomyces spororaveus]
MHSIEFRVAPQSGGGQGRGETPSAVEFLVDGIPFLELVRRAELPDAFAEQQERAAEFAPDPVPLLAGAYAYPALLSARNLLGGEPDRVPHGAERGETLLLSCTCGIDDCWALTAHITVTDTTVTWSGFRNNSRDWNHDSLGILAFSRPQYEQSLRAALDALSALRS